MARYDRLIGFLEREAQFLKMRITHLKEREGPSGITTGDAVPGPLDISRRDAEAKLAEIEHHIRELRRDLAA